MTTKKQIKLGAFLPGSGHHVAAWRHPQSQADGGLNFQHYQQLAHAERGKFDMVFLADGLAVWDRGQGKEAFSRSGQFSVHFEPLTLLSALSVVTKNIGLVATASTTYEEPFHIARKFASLVCSGLSMKVAPYEKILVYLVQLTNLPKLHLLN